MGSPVASGFDANEGHLPEADMDGSEHFYAPYRPGFGPGYGYGLNFPNIHFAAGLGGFPGVLPGVIPPPPFFFRK